MPPVRNITPTDVPCPYLFPDLLSALEQDETLLFAIQRSSSGPARSHRTLRGLMGPYTLCLVSTREPGVVLGIFWGE